MKTIQQRANQVARQYGHGSAHIIILGTKDRILSHISYGYRKYTTGEYVPNSYRNKFGWKNTYYQYAETTVEIDVLSMPGGLF